MRPVFAAGPTGDWRTTRLVNILIFAASYVAYLLLLWILLPPPRTSSSPERRRWLLRASACLLLFAATQTCLGQVSRVNPDELVTALYLLACTLLLWLLRSKKHTWRIALSLGGVLAAGFVAKAAFLPLGLEILAVAVLGRLFQRAPCAPVLGTAFTFAAVVLAYSGALSHAVGYRTLGDAGALNYAWHVDRLQKWVHWEGGVLPAAEAWPGNRLARFTQWDSRPPDFGVPVHPSSILQTSPRVYGFAAPVHATYVPYFDPPYFYQGFRKVVRARYQLIAFGKSTADLFTVLVRHPIAWGLLIGCVVVLATGERKWTGSMESFRGWPLAVSGLLGIALFLPVHLEGRYVTGMLLVLATCVVVAITGNAFRTERFEWVFLTCLLVSFVAELAVYQLPVWRNLLHGTSPQANVEWRMGTAVLDQRLPEGATVGVIAWTPNLHCDWAYIAHVQIIAEIASEPDYEQFWHATPAVQTSTLATFRRAGAVAVFVNAKPPGLGDPAWQQLNGTPLSMLPLR